MVTVWLFRSTRVGFLGVWGTGLHCYYLVFFCFGQARILPLPSLMILWLFRAKGERTEETILQRCRGSVLTPAGGAVVNCGLCSFLLWGSLDPIFQPSSVRHSRAWQHCFIGAMCQETANGEAPRNEPCNSWVPCSLTWAAAGLAAWWPSGLMGVLCVYYMAHGFSLPVECWLCGSQSSGRGLWPLGSPASQRSLVRNVLTPWVWLLPNSVCVCVQLCLRISAGEKTLGFGRAVEK